MIKTRKAIAALVAVAAAAAALALVSPGSSAAASGGNAGLGDYVVVRNEGGVLQVATGVPGQPLVGATVDSNTGSVCVGFSLQVPFCTSSVVIDGAVTSSAIPSPVWVDVNPSDGFVGAGVRVGTGSIVAVGYNTATSTACVRVGMADSFCADLG